MYTLTIRRPGSLTGGWELDLNDDELAAIGAVLGMHDHAEGEPCTCPWQFPNTITLRALGVPDLAPGRERHGQLTTGLYELVQIGRDREQRRTIEANHAAMIGGDTAD